MNSPLSIFLFIGEVILIFFLAHSLLNVSFNFLRKLHLSDSIIIRLVAVLYLPGTILHEISHYIFALLLGMNPEEVSIFPHIEKNHIQLGHVLYRRHQSDVVRPIIVGIAPFFGAMGTLWAIESFHLFPGQTWWLTVLFGYLILTITANMFSSKQDLVDLIYVIPLFIIIGVIVYILGIQINTQILAQMIRFFEIFFNVLQVPLLFSIIVHGILILTIKIILPRL